MQSTSSRLQLNEANSQSDEIIYVQHARVNGVSNHAPEQSSDTDDDWSQGADESIDTTMIQLSNHVPSPPLRNQSTNRPSWSDDGAVNSDSGTHHSASLTNPNSGSISDSDDSASASAATSAATAMTRPPQTLIAQAAPAANPLQGHQARATAAKFSCYKVTGPVMIIISLAGLGWGISLLLQGTDVLPRPVDYDGKPVKSDGLLMAGTVSTTVFTLLGVAGACITKYC